MTKRRYNYECQDEVEVQIKRERVEGLTNSVRNFFSETISKSFWGIFSNAGDTLKKPFKLLSQCFSGKNNYKKDEALIVDRQINEETPHAGTSSQVSPLNTRAQDSLSEKSQKEVIDHSQDIVIYTDGSYIKSKTFGKKSGIGIYISEGHPLNKSLRLFPPYNSYMTEIQSIMTALQSVQEWPDYKQERIVIRTDGKHILYRMRNVLEHFGLVSDEINDLYTLASQLPNGVLFEHVYAHSGNTGNDEADKLARAAIGLPPNHAQVSIRIARNPIAVLILPSIPELNNQDTLKKTDQEFSSSQTEDFQRNLGDEQDKNKED